MMTLKGRVGRDVVSECERLEQGIAALEAQRPVLGDAAGVWITEALWK